MASRPRPSILALFDPLIRAEAASPTQARDAVSPDSSLESGSDKENLISTTPKGSWSKASDNGGWDLRHVCDSNTQVEHFSKKDNGGLMDLLGDSFSLEKKVDDASNLCLVQLADELAIACEVVEPEEVIARRPRGPLSEIGLGSSNVVTRTPQNLTRDKRLISLDTPSTTPNSLRKFAAGIKKCEISTPVAYCPLAAPQGTLRHTSSGLCSVSGTHQISHSATTPASVDLVQPCLSAPSASSSPSLLSFAPAPDPSPVFCDPPPCPVGSSFEIRNSKLNFSGDLLTDDLSFLERIEDESLADFVRASDSDDTDGPSPKALPEADRTENKLTQKPCISMELRQNAVDEQRNDATTGNPAWKTSSRFRRSSSHSGLTFAAVREEALTTPSSPMSLEMHTPSSSPLVPRLDRREHVLAPKKVQTALRRRNTLSRSTSARVVGTVEEGSEDEANTLQTAKPSPLRARPSSLENVPLTKSKTLIGRRTGIDPTPINNDAPINIRRPSVSRLSIGRQASIGHILSPVKPKVPTITPARDEVPRRPATSLAQSTRRLSASASSKPAPSKTNSFATTGRVGGARRVPFTANAPLYKPSDVAINKAKSPMPIPRAVTMHEKTGPQRPPIVSSSNNLGRGASIPKVASNDDKAPPTIAPAKIRTLGRTTSASSGVFNRTSFMTSSSSSMVSTSRLPVASSKSTSRIPKPGTRAVFR